MLGRPIRVALVGCGAMGRLHARALRAEPSRFTLIGGLDVAPERVAALDLAPLASLEEAVEAAELVVVATPIESHAALVLGALEAGCDVFVEKPSGATFREAATLVDAARRAGRRLFVGHSERFNPVVRTLTALLRGERPIRIELTRTAAVRPDALRDGRERVLLNLGVHDMDLVAYLTGAPIAVEWARGTHERAEVALAAGACAARLHVGRTEAPRARRIEVTTATHAYEGDLLRLELVVRDLATGAARRAEVEPGEPVVLQMRALGAALAGGEDVALARELATGIDGARAILGVEAAEAALAPPSERADRAGVSSAENL